MMLTDEQLHDLDYTYHKLHWNIIPAKLENGIKKPAVKDFDIYFDSKTTVSYEQLIEHTTKKPNALLMVVLGEQKNGKVQACWDIDTKDESVRKLFLHYFPSSLWQETKRGYHFFIGIEGNADDIRRFFEGKESVNRQYKITDDIKVENYIFKHGMVFLGENYGKLQGELVYMTKEEFYDATRSFIDALYLYVYLKDVYKEKVRNDIIYRLSGILAKKRPEKIGVSIVDGLTYIFNDEERKGRITVTKNSYKKVKEGEALNTKLEEVIPKDTAKKIYEYFDYKPNGNGNNNSNNVRKKLDEFIVTPDEKEAYVILDLAKKYTKGSPTIQGLYLLHFYKEGDDEDASFLNNYRYVRDPDDKNEGYWIEWTGYCWRKVDNAVLKSHIDKFFKHKIKKINELYKEIPDMVSVEVNHGTGNDSNTDGNNDENINENVQSTVDDNNNNHNNHNNNNNKYSSIIARLKLLILEEENPIKAIIRIKKWIEEEREQVSELLTYAIKSDTTKNEVLKSITTMNEYLSEGFVIDKTELEPAIITIDGKEYDIFINTKTHLLYWDDEIEDFIAVEHGENTKRLYLTRAMDVEFIQGMKCPKFISFLREICEGNQELMNYLAIIGGMLMIPRREEKFFIFTGSGFNGKSTLLKVYSGILSNNGYEADAEDINEFAEGLSPNAYRMIRCISIIVDDPRVQDVDTLVLKSLVSTGSTNVRTLWSEPVTVEKRFNIILAINGRLKVLEHDKAMFRRMVYVRFNYTVQNPKDNYHLELLKEKNGIFNYFLAGLAEYLRRKKHENADLLKIAPDAVRAETDRQIWSYDHLKEFIDRYLVINLDKKRYRESISLLYARYLEFCDLKGIQEDMRLSKRKFSERLLIDFGIESVVIDKVTYKVGVMLKDKPLIEDLEIDLYEDERKLRKEEVKKEEVIGNNTNNTNNTNIDNNNNNANNTNANNNNTNNNTNANNINNTNTNSNTNSTKKVGRIYIKKRYIVTIKKVNDRELECTHCNARYTDTYKLMKHIKEIAGVSEFNYNDLEIVPVGVGSTLLDYTNAD